MKQTLCACPNRRLFMPLLLLLATLLCYDGAFAQASTPAEYPVSVQMRDGVTLAANIYRLRAG